MIDSDLLIDCKLQLGDGCCVYRSNKNTEETSIAPHQGEGRKKTM